MMKNNDEFKRRIREAIRLANRNGFVGTEEALRLLESGVEDTVSSRNCQITTIRFLGMKHTRHESSTRINEAERTCINER